MFNHKILSTDIKGIVKEINKLRLSNKNNWFCFHGEYNGKVFKAKVYGTWLQIFLIDNKNASNTMNQTPTQFKKHIESYLVAS